MNNNSLKGLIQGIVGDGTALVQGIVQSASPLRISLVNDPSMIIPQSLLIVPEHLTKRTLSVKLSVSGAAGNTDSGGSGTTGSGGGGNTGDATQNISGTDYTHNHSVSEHTHSTPAHSHSISSLSVTNKDATIIVDDSLKAGEYVHLLSVGKGKIFFVLGRV